MTEDNVQQEAESLENLEPMFKEAESSEEEDEPYVPPRRQVAFCRNSCDFEEQLPPKRQKAIGVRGFEALRKVDAELQSFLQRVCLADNKDKAESAVSPEEKQPQQQIRSQSKVQQGQGNSSTEPTNSGKPRSASRWSMMSSKMWLTMQMVRTSDPSRGTSFKKICPEPVES
eukprot:TRINITY_DN18626_c0_g1_i1.p1 TRINITY_DN18626_c0_g1~~TRINITY_DN18626_c0_g1_i1.p1  ORF type:complete len:172 (-),score=38.15 TRINITY_DN18626_c0_g1_i1:207-722(-)